MRRSFLHACFLSLVALWLADRGGWHAPDVVGRFADYADRVARQLCDVARWWITVNEPSVAGSMGYIDGGWPLIRRLLHDGTGLVLDVKAKLDRSSQPAGIELWRL